MNSMTRVNVSEVSCNQGTSTGVASDAPVETAVAVIDSQGHVFLANKAWWHFVEAQEGGTGHAAPAPSDVFACYARNQVHGSAICEAIRAVVAGKRKYVSTEFETTASGCRHSFHVEISARADGNPGAILSQVDITKCGSLGDMSRCHGAGEFRLNEELENTYKQLLQSGKLAAIGQLAAGVAHEINNPVGYINSNCQSLQQYIGDLCRLLDLYQDVEPEIADETALAKITALKTEIDIEFLREDVRSLLEESQEGIERVMKIVQDLKNFSRTDEPEWSFADLNDGINSTLNIVHNELKYKADIKLELGNIPHVECILPQLNQVFMNLLVNASQAIEKRGVITVRTGSDGPDWVWVEVTDTGSGISAENMKRLFEPFFTTKPAGKGTGLGMSMSASIVEKHGGRIEVSSELGKGARFRVVLPVHQAASGREAG